MSTTPHPPTRRTGRVVVLVSGTGSTLAAVLTANDDPAYGARVVAVVADRADAGGLQRARDAGVPTVVVAPADFADRPAWDRAMTEAVAVFDPDLVLLAGFMRLVGAPFLDRFGGRTLNTHPALLPAFPGGHAVRDALAYGVTVSGCTVHLVDAGVDTGPVLAQAAVAVEPDDDEAALRARIQRSERALVVQTLGRAAREGLRVEGRRVRFGSPVPR